MGLEIENERRLGEVIGSHFDSGRCLTLFMQVTGGPTNMYLAATLLDLACLFGTPCCGDNNSKK